MIQIHLWPRRAIILLIRAYQHTISPDHSLIGKALFPHGYCQFTPSCSQYGAEAVERFGMFRGIILGTGRVFRCAPWNPGGYDPVPQRRDRGGGGGRA